MASPERQAVLLRALDGVLIGQGDTVVPIVVVNGARFHPPLVEHLKARRDIRFLYREEPNPATAAEHGRMMVDTPFFSMLDDDDEVLSGAIPARLAPLLEHPHIDAVVTNGYVCRDGQACVDYPDFLELGREPLAALQFANWLRPCNALYRTATIATDYFRHVPQFLEQTYVAYRLAMERKIHFLDKLTYRYHVGSPSSVSASERYLLGQPESIRAILTLDLPAPIKAGLRRKLCDSHHEICEHALQSGDRAAAWRHHLRSLASGGGYRYLTYTRKLIAGTLGLVRIAER
jgi:hypothetical protein